MKLSKLKPGDNFLTDSGTKFKVVVKTRNELKAKHLKKHIKVFRIDTEETYFIDDLIIRKI